MISFKKLKIFSGKISWNNMCSDLAVKWLSLISIKSEQVSKICSMVKRLSHPIHIGGSSPFNKKEWVIKEWPMCNQATTVSSFLFVREQTIHSFSIGNILYNLFSRNSSHSDCHSSNIHLFVRDFRSENGMSSTEMSPSGASLAAESAADFPLMPTWPGTQMIFLERLADRLRCTHVETVAIVKPWEDTGSNKSPGCIFSEKPADWTNAFKLKISSLADFSDKFLQFRVKNESKVPGRIREGDVVWAKSNQIREGNGRRFQGRWKGKEKSLFYRCSVWADFLSSTFLCHLCMHQVLW